MLCWLSLAQLSPLLFGSEFGLLFIKQILTSMDLFFCPSCVSFCNWWLSFKGFFLSNQPSWWLSSGGRSLSGMWVASPTYQPTSSSGQSVGKLKQSFLSRHLPGELSCLQTCPSGSSWDQVSPIKATPRLSSWMQGIGFLVLTQDRLCHPQTSPLMETYSHCSISETKEMKHIFFLVSSSGTLPHCTTFFLMDRVDIGIHHNSCTSCPMPPLVSSVEPAVQLVVSSTEFWDSTIVPRPPISKIILLKVTVAETESPPIGVCLYFAPAWLQGPTTRTDPKASKDCLVR